MNAEHLRRRLQFVAAELNALQASVSAAVMEIGSVELPACEMKAEMERQTARVCGTAQMVDKLLDRYASRVSRPGEIRPNLMLMDEFVSILEAMKEKLAE